MKAAIGTLATLVISCGIMAQPGPRAIDQLQKSKASEYASTITKVELQEHLLELASDAYEGRETGKPGQKKAAAYIADYYKSLGIAPCNNGSYFQQYPLKQEGVKMSYMEVGGTRYKFVEDFYFFPYFETKETFDLSNVVFVGYGITAEGGGYDDYAGIDVKGKVVMCLAGEPRHKDGKSRISGTDIPSEWSQDMGKKVELAESKGATCVLFVNVTHDMNVSRIRYWLENPGMRLDYPVGHSMSEEEAAGGDMLPSFFLSPKTSNALLKSAGKKSYEAYKKKIDSKGKPIRFTMTTKGKIHVKRESQRVEAENVLAYIEGSDPMLKDEVVVISAHYDHIGITNGQINNGADDDGSGTVSALEIAEAFMEAKKAGNGPRRSILILNVSGEEKGLLGSEWYSEFPIYPLQKTVCDLNIDMIGRKDEQHPDENYVYLIGSDKLSTQLHTISEEANTAHTHLALDYTYNDPEDPNRFYYRSDHYNFAKHGIPVIFYFSGVHEDYHKPGDDVEKILFDKMTTIAQLVFYTAWEVANRDQKLVVDVANDFKERE